MVRKTDPNTWQEDPADVILLVNRSAKNYILELPAGRVRLDAGRSIRTLTSILDINAIRDLVSEGLLSVEYESRR